MKYKIGLLIIMVVRLFAFSLLPGDVAFPIILLTITADMWTIAEVSWQNKKREEEK